MKICGDQRIRRSLMQDDRDELIDAATTDEECAALWHSLVGDLTRVPCKHPRLRDDLVDWLRGRASLQEGLGRD
jgi:hypothetical protein